MVWNGEKYEKNSPMQFKSGLHAIDLLNPKSPEKILDIGCGPGILSLEIAKRLGSGKIVGVDVDARMIDAAQQAIGRSKIKNFSVLQKNATDLAFHEEFDAVFSNFVIPWIPDLPKLWQVLYAALKPGGRLVIATTYIGDPSSVTTPPVPEMITDAAIKKVTIGEIDGLVLEKFYTEGHLAAIVPPAEMHAYNADMSKHLTFNIPRRKDLQRKLEKAGFHDIQIDSQTIRHEFETLDAYMDNQEAASWLKFLSALPAEYRDKACQCVRDLLRAEWDKMPDGQKAMPFQEEWSVAFIQAKKQ
nr:methyltransferase domain-containing protein [Candidatus Sigynarchaeota archaeon]